MLRGVRWKYLLNPAMPVSSFKLFSLLIVGFFMNNLLPLRLGELVRAHITGQKLQMSRSNVLATIVVERLFDGISYVCLFVVTVILLPSFPELAKRSFLLGGAVFGGAMLFLFFLVRNKERAAGMLRKIPMPEKMKPHFQRISINFLNGLGIFGRGKALITVFILSLIIWTIEGSVFLMMSNAFHLNMNLLQCFFVMITIGIGAALPTAPGYVGTVEFLGVTALTFLGINKDQAFGYIVTLHLLQFVTIAFWGIRTLLTEKISFSELIRVKK
jgi:uncharacterized protein (TIRG00374 family)